MQLTIREPGSAITHFIGCLMALIRQTSPTFNKSLQMSGDLAIKMIWFCK